MTASTANRPPTRLNYALAGSHLISASSDPMVVAIAPAERRFTATLWSEGPYPGARYRYRGDQHPDHTTDWQATPELALEAFNKIGERESDLDLLKRTLDVAGFRGSVDNRCPPGKEAELRECSACRWVGPRSETIDLGWCPRCRSITWEKKLEGETDEQYEARVMGRGTKSEVGECT